jgi:hypothetical protein
VRFATAPGKQMQLDFGQKRVIDNPKAMVLEHDTATSKVVLHPAFAGFCKDWGLEVHACKPARVWTEGMVESGIKYIKHNALAGLLFTCFEALQSHLLRWMEHADSRAHGTTHHQPQQTFAAAEQAILQPLLARLAPARTRRLRRKVANDALVNVDTVRYSVPHGQIGETVEVMGGIIRWGNTNGALHHSASAPQQPPKKA